jgi:hypothetical protein
VDPEVERMKAELEQRQNEGRIGDWERVVVRKPPPPAVKVEEEVKAETGEDEDPEVREKARQEEERPSTARWLKEKTRELDPDELYDPSKVGPLKLKRKVLTLKEEEEVRLEEERKKKVKREKEEERRRSEGVVKQGWQEVEVKREEMLMFEQRVKEEEEAVKVEEGGEVGAVAEEDVKPVVVASGFKKRKMHGANAARKK